ncbi:penicillin-binding protein 1A [Cytophaga hutchinsonii]|uniref:Candidate bifunctional family GT51 b-glycosyltransferase/PBP transpeptidase, candidate murein polymerase, glycosyltransferase family 51 protein n=1 Tax=Cytophaga hutchinsonii (strain ATCC 33406 / DSM 1761 / CIP 103989 / NBRC 15051 / NCIMB 9469 / D465) TaxID=269798 RepID=A0A6N4SS18_CYTH3|nr:PBP1A family penicillin-binding protein [Cytophaga hutchinsonii]ABG59154.1 candidate bifunctional family GT51 b-glycosyltransferase/PBP transpeptidase, candidate murein polymerase, glycosyltransferase family 51 protein [Cytophaga hutchinsonii ATCC 33406]SFX35476.1 penicillin-binding protein 1A [Cytophaga hutchinsonii ATCC 33406]
MKDYNKLVSWLWKGAAAMFAGIIFLLLLVYINPFNLFGSLPSIDVLENPESDQASVIYSSDGKVLGKFYNQINRTDVEYKDLPPVLINALIATEDSRFYDHSGVDVKGIVAIAPSLMIGRRRGSSTLTQQLAKNLFSLRRSEEYTGILDNTIVHKIKEWFIAIQLEKSYSKNEILLMYLNTVEFGNNSFGIRSAAKKYFGKNVHELQLNEAALLVGLLKGPSYYNPRKKPERAKNRRNTVLDQMVKYEYLSSAEAVIAQAKPLNLNFQDDGEAAGLAPHFRNYLKKVMFNWCKEHDMHLYEDGLKIYTTIDTRLQEVAEDAVKKHMSFLQKEFDKNWSKSDPWTKSDPDLVKKLAKTTSHYKELTAELDGNESLIMLEMKKKIPMQIFTWKGRVDTIMSPLDSIRHSLRMLRTGLFSMDPKTGYVRAWVGNIDYANYPFDHVLQGKRQAGSTFKPILYAYTMEEKGLTPDSKFPDAPISIPVPGGSPWTPNNSNGKFSNEEITLRQALARSVNSISAQLMNLVGPDSVVAFAKRMGIKSPLEPTPALCLGTGDVTLFEMVNAYSVFVNEGIWMQPQFLLRIEDKYGNVLEEFNTNSRQVINEETAYNMIELLKGSVEEAGGTSVDLRSKFNIHGDLGGKTGTTQESADGWFMGITPNLVTGVWVGGEKRVIRFSTMTYGQGARMALPVWAYYMQGVQKHSDAGYPASLFTKPDGNVNVTSDKVNILDDGMLPQDAAEDEVYDY